MLHKWRKYFVFKRDSLDKKIKIDTFLPITKPTFAIDSLDPTIGYVQYDWQEKRKYKLSLFANALTDKWSRNNTDTLSRIYEINSKDKYGNLKATITDLDSSILYTVQLIGKNDAVVQTDIIANQKEYIIPYKNLPATNYTIRIIHDLLPNRRWDTGNYIQKRQPEPITNSKQITLKEGWENEIIISILTNKKGKS